MNTTVLNNHWFAALTTWLRKPAHTKAPAVKPANEQKPRVRIAGLR